MRVTVCELPHEREPLAAAWAALREHVAANASELVLLPELAMAEPLWESERFDEGRWSAAEHLGEVQLTRVRELGAPYVVGTRAIRANGRRLNEAFLWCTGDGARTLRSKHFMPEEPGGWEATWFDRGDPEFPAFRAGTATFGVNICSEMWALDTFAAYATLGVELMLAPRASARATMAKWLAAGVVAAVRAGAFCVSSNRVDAKGAYGGGGWIIDPDGDVLALTSAAEPFATREIDLTRSAMAKQSYPRYVFSR